MTYEEFLNLPVAVLKDLETILILKGKYHMDITKQEEELFKHITKCYDERIASLELSQNKEKLERLLELSQNKEKLERLFRK
jgi:hypothetical protein